MSDERLMRAVRDGAVAKLGLLFERHHVRLFEFLCRMTGDRATADDLVQETFVRMLKYRQTFRDEGRFETWMYHIARNARLDHFRKRRLERPLDDASPETAAKDPDAERRAMSREQAVLLKRALLKLPDEKRELIVLARYRGLKYDEIAGILEIDVGTVRVRLHRALKELRALMGRDRDEEQRCDVRKSATSLPIA